jgi:hypothetical protein
MPLRKDELLRFLCHWNSRLSLVLGSIVLFGLAAGEAALGQAPVADRWSQVSAANNLDVKGNTEVDTTITVNFALTHN